VGSASVYWTTPGVINACPSNGGCKPIGATTTMGTNYASFGTEITFDPSTGYLFLEAGNGAGTANSLIDVPGSGNGTALVPVASGSTLGGVATDATAVYWYDNESVFRAAKNGSNKTTLITGLVSTYPVVAVDGANVYATGTGRIVKCAKTGAGCGGSPQVVNPGFGGTFLAVDPQAAFVYNGAWSAIYRCPVAGCASTPSAWVTGSSSTAIGAIAVDPNYVYWTDTYLNKVMACAVGSTCGTALPLATSQTKLQAIAQDARAVYWISNGTVYLLAK
jgi:hypothetical protein